MINNEAFAKRLQKVIDFYDESASSFAEKIGVQRSSISHILSGRNKPSLDFIMKILSSYPEVELYWLLNGKGTFPAKQQKETTPLENSSKIALKENKDKTIERIVIFYKDGSFNSFKE
jgi:transcriptional regulator with XRE-family HTH domain